MNQDMFMFSNQIANEWDFKWYGFFGAEEANGIKPFILEDYLDYSCPSEVKRKIVYYLRKSPVYLFSFETTRSKCKCGDFLCTGLFRADGIWLWPDSLSHVVEKHNICIPNKMLKQILDVEGVPPTEIIAPNDQITWPK
jgi:hypothetical protein